MLADSADVRSMDCPESERRAIATRLNGIYVIVGHSQTSGMSALDVAQAAIDGGACAIQLRDKTSPRADIARAAEAMTRLCNDSGVLFIVNDDPRLAAQVGSDGVHVGQGDASISECRSVLEGRQIVGRSNATVAEVRESIQHGVDYVAVGAMFQSSTKRDTRPAGIETLAAAVQLAEVPVVAIGGINAGNVGLIAATGANAACVASAVTEAADPERATSELLRNFMSAKR